jgi:hypothetical protein
LYGSQLEKSDVQEQQKRNFKLVDRIVVVAKSVDKLLYLTEPWLAVSYKEQIAAYS